MDAPTSAVLQADRGELSSWWASWWDRGRRAKGRPRLIGLVARQRVDVGLPLPLGIGDLFCQGRDGCTMLLGYSDQPIDLVVMRHNRSGQGFYYRGQPIYLFVCCHLLLPP